jgi:DMSO/TMAO reductase YedYZ molybdopterin-dependent catalytic subunit
VFADATPSPFEGWSYIGGWTGVPLRVFLERVGADLRAKYVAFKTADEYPSSIDTGGLGFGRRSDTAGPHRKDEES